MDRLLFIGMVAVIFAGCERSEVFEIPEGHVITTDRDNISHYLVGRTGCELPRNAINLHHKRSWGKGERHESVEFEIGEEDELEKYFYELIRTLPELRRPSNEDESLFIYGIGSHQKWGDISFSDHDEYKFQFGSDTYGHWENITIFKSAGSVKFYRQTW